MIRKLITVAALSGTMALGAVGVASAATPTTPSSSSTVTGQVPINCTNALALVPKIQAREAMGNTWLPKAQARESAAKSAGHTKLEALIARRITRVQKREALGNKVVAAINTACSSSASSAGNAS
ncbi:MAG: hypothetical protein ACLPVF_02380 [Acidimicrobiales bacterium]